MLLILVLRIEGRLFDFKTSPVYKESYRAATEVTRTNTCFEKKRKERERKEK